MSKVDHPNPKNLSHAYSIGYSLRRKWNRYPRADRRFNFTNVGVRSLLSIVIASRFREELGSELEAKFSIFVDLRTIKTRKLSLPVAIAEAKGQRTCPTPTTSNPSRL